MQLAGYSGMCLPDTGHRSPDSGSRTRQVGHCVSRFASRTATRQKRKHTPKINCILTPQHWRPAQHSQAVLGALVQKLAHLIIHDAVSLFHSPCYGKGKVALRVVSTASKRGPRCLCRRRCPYLVRSSCWKDRLVLPLSRNVG